MVGKLVTDIGRMRGTSARRRAAMTMQEGAQGSWGGPAGRQLHDKAYFLDLLGDSHNGLGRHEAAIEAYRQAAEGFRSQGAHCSYALCLFKIAESHLSLGEPWHALGYLEACLPLLRRAGTDQARDARAQRLAPARPSWPGAVSLAGRASRNTVAVSARQG